MTTTHWTAHSDEDFLYSIASDFVEQLRSKMKKVGMTQSKLAKAAKVSKSYVSQVFNDPGNLSLVTIVKFAKAVGMKVSVMGYEDENDPNNTRGPINSDIFRRCWENADRPADMWAIKEKAAAKTDAVAIDKLLANMEWGRTVFNQTSNNARRNLIDVFASVSYKALSVTKAKHAEWNADHVIKYSEVQ